MRQLVILTSLTLASLSVFAKDSVTYTCTSNGAERVIEVSYSSDNATPCEVTYTKDGEKKTLWHYESTEGMCDSKAAEFAEKQIHWGWSCSNIKQAATTSPDTDTDTDTTE